MIPQGRKQNCDCLSNLIVVFPFTCQFQAFLAGRSQGLRGWVQLWELCNPGNLLTRHLANDPFSCSSHQISTNITSQGKSSFLRRDCIWLHVKGPSWHLEPNRDHFSPKRESRRGQFRVCQLHSVIQVPGPSVFAWPFLKCFVLTVPLWSKMAVPTPVIIPGKMKK